MPIVPSLPNSGVAKQRNIIFIPTVRHIEILTNLVASTPKAANGRGDNREDEVGRRGRRWERIDDHIEEETTSKCNTYVI